MDYDNWLWETKTLLSLTRTLDEDETARFQVWFDRGFSPRGAAQQYLLLYGKVPNNF